MKAIFEILLVTGNWVEVQVLEPSVGAMRELEKAANRTGVGTLTVGSSGTESIKLFINGSKTDRLSVHTAHIVASYWLPSESDEVNQMINQISEDSK